MGYYIEREEGWAERDLKRELEGMERRIVELAALLVAPCNRALGMLRKARAAQWSERESRGWTPSISLEEAATDYELDGLTGGTEILVREYVGRRGEPWEYSEVEQTPAEIRDLIRRAVEEITDLVRPAATTGTEMFRRPEGAEVLDEVGFSDMVRRAAIYVEALDE